MGQMALTASTRSWLPVFLLMMSKGMSVPVTDSDFTSWFLCLLHFQSLQAQWYRTIPQIHCSAIALCYHFWSIQNRACDVLNINIFFMNSLKAFKKQSRCWLSTIFSNDAGSPSRHVRSCQNYPCLKTTFCICLLHIIGCVNGAEMWDEGAQSQFY